MSRSLLHCSDSRTRRHILRAALKRFAERGYAATSVQEIVDAARVSKPALYYYFKDKAGLFHALVDHAHDERYRLMQEAAGRGRAVAEKLEEIVAAIFEFSSRNRELMRLAFATAFAAAGDAPTQVRCLEKGRRNFEFIRSLIEAGQKSGELDRGFSVDELTMGIYGQVNSYLMVRLLAPECPTTRHTATQIVRLFMAGAGTAGKERRHPRRQRSTISASGANGRPAPALGHAGTPNGSRHLTHDS